MKRAMSKWLNAMHDREIDRFAPEFARLRFEVFNRMMPKNATQDGDFQASLAFALGAAEAGSIEFLRKLYPHIEKFLYLPPKARGGDTRSREQKGWDLEASIDADVYRSMRRILREHKVKGSDPSVVKEIVVQRKAKTKKEVSQRLKQLEKVLKHPPNTRRFRSKPNGRGTV
jgi:hypothetical protein